jgi:hypothetical protein
VGRVRCVGRHAGPVAMGREGLMQLGRERSWPMWHYFFQFLIKSNRLQTSKIRTKFNSSRIFVKQILLDRSRSVLGYKNIK